MHWNIGLYSCRNCYLLLLSFTVNCGCKITYLHQERGRAFVLLFVGAILNHPDRPYYLVNAIKGAGPRRLLQIFSAYV